ncbi:MAG: nuclear transport factor 2 family protein [Rhodothermales bacterium]
MTRFLFFLILVLTTSACELRVREPSGEEKSQIVNEVLALTNEIRLAAESADAEGLFRYHSDAPDAAHIIDGKQFTRGQMISNYRNVYASVESQSINIGDPVVKVLSPELVLVVSQGNFTSNATSGSSLSGGIAWTYLWKKQNEAWTLLHAHQSFPGPISRADQ